MQIFWLGLGTFKAKRLTLQKSNDNYEDVFAPLYLFSLWMKAYFDTIQIKPVHQYFYLEPNILRNKIFFFLFNLN